MILQKRIIIHTVILSLLMIAWAPAMSLAQNDCDCPPGTKAVPTGWISFRNQSGADCNDLHFTAYQRERGVDIKKACIEFPPTAQHNHGFDNYDVNYRENIDPPPQTWHDDGLNHVADFTVSGGVVPQGQTLWLKVIFCLNKKNQIFLKGVNTEWTNDGQPCGPDPDGVGGSGARNQGWWVGRPYSGGTGGNTTDPGGGGEGAQEGGGGNGPYIHMVCIHNESAEPVLLTELKLLATMNDYPGLEDIDWSSIDPIQNDEIPPEPPVEIAPYDKWCYEFNTTGDYIGGHIYMKYILEDVGGPKDSPEDEAIIADHPPDSLCEFATCDVMYEFPDEIPTLTEWGLIFLGILLAGWMGWLIMRRRKRAVEGI